METWTIRPHYKDNTFNARRLTFPFTITDCDIIMELKLANNVNPTSNVFVWETQDVGNVSNIESTVETEIPFTPIVFSWSTLNNTIEKFNATQVILERKLLNVPAGNYVGDVKVIFEDGTVYTQFLVLLPILDTVPL